MIYNYDSFQTDITMILDENISSTETTSSTISMNLNKYVFKILDLGTVSKIQMMLIYYFLLNIKLYNKKIIILIYLSGFV